ncbi:DUF192 domain-containing protein [Roseomonas sp. CECT 9278]|uniref:DUF192 domain-containing protein n=1 Tax=Roseomonas sp. CECT 9278 TaxID=2845823 RepID=UPI001E36FA6E|nr:DUF192 domain-containing protein [Roseomonas sp. CECT 9278]CAH0187744.1 hypothetical protein ROS9278_01606 [Roseomonas sp. CECT 9278]
MILRRAVLALAALSPLPLRAQPGVDRPQPRLPTEPLVIALRDGRRLPFTVEMAVAPEHQMIGLMFRPEVKPDEGMLFDWGTPRESSMWMRNTITSLDMVFIAADGRIHRIAERTVPLSLATVSSGGPVRATLELRAGITEQLGISAGDRVLHRIFGTAP